MGEGNNQRTQINNCLAYYEKRMENHMFSRDIQFEKSPERILAN